MSDDGSHKVEVSLSSESMRMLEACAAWRKVSVGELVRAYVEDWLDIDYPESQGVTRVVAFIETGQSPSMSKRGNRPLRIGATNSASADCNPDPRERDRQSP
jgi:hypothetical protein